MSESLRFLDRLAQEAGKSLPPQEVESLVAEAREHLEDAIQARLELRMSFQEAEAEAIAAFGLSRQVVEASLPRSAPRLRIGLFASGYALAGLYTLFSWRFMDYYPDSVEALFAAWLVLGLAFAAVAFHARRPASAPVVLTGMVGAVAFWLLMGLTWIDLKPYGGMGVLPPGAAAEQMRVARKGLVEREADREALAAGLRALDGPRGIEALRTAEGYRAPVDRPSWGYEDRVTFTTVADAKTAQRSWRSVVQRTRQHLQAAEFLSVLKAVPMAVADPAYKNLLFVAPSVLEANVAIVALVTLIDFAFGWLGHLAHTFRRRRKGGLHA